jgi:uncharacterized membrane protein YgcG
MAPSRLLATAGAVAALLAHGAGAAPVLSVIGYEPAAWTPSEPCPFPPGDPVWRCDAAAVKLTVIGDGFGVATGSVQAGGAIPSPPAPPPAPDDTPPALTLAALTSGTGARDGCIAASLYTADGNAYRFCPYGRVDLLDPGQNHAYVGDLGTYAGVIREAVPAAGNCTALTGQLFLDGSMCGGVPRTARVLFTCIDDTAPQQDYYTRVPQIYAATPTDGAGCSYDLELPLPAACPGTPAYGLCGAANPSPNPAPSPSPVFAYTPAFVGGWNDVAVTAYVMGAAPPPTVRLVTSDGSGATPPTAPVPAPLEPSRSPVPVPFPGNLQLLGIVPASGPSTGGTRVTLMMAGVTRADITGFDARFFATVPTGPSSSSSVALLGGPVGVDGAPPVVPANGLLNLTLASFPARRTLDTMTLRVASRQWLDGWFTNRQADCAPLPGLGCDWTYVTPATPSGSGSASASATPPPTPSHTAGVSASATGSASATPSPLPTVTHSVGASPSVTDTPPPSASLPPVRLVAAPVDGVVVSHAGVAGIGIGYALAAGLAAVAAVLLDRAWARRRSVAAAAAGGASSSSSSPGGGYYGDGDAAGGKGPYGGGGASSTAAATRTGPSARALHVAAAAGNSGAAAPGATAVMMPPALRAAAGAAHSDSSPPPSPALMQARAVRAAAAGSGSPLPPPPPSPLLAPPPAALHPYP